MFKHNDTNKVIGIGIHLVNEKWAIPSFMSIGVRDGATLAVAPVRLIHIHDRQKLSELLRRAFSEERKVISEEEFYRRQPGPSAEARALGFDNQRDFERKARFFSLVRMPGRLIVEEWPKAKGGAFIANPPVWSNEFGPDEFDNVAECLVEKAGTTTAAEGQIEAVPAIRSDN